MDLLDGRLKFRHLILLIAVYERGSVVRAAESLHLTQPAATRTLRELEALADLPLFVRVPRGMRPTVYGEALTEHARAVVAEIRRAGDHLTGLRQGRDGTVTVGTLLAGANVLLPRAVAGLKRERPRLTVVVREGTPDVLHPALLAGELDVIVGRVGSTPSQGDGLRQRKLYREPIRLAVRSGHPLLDTADVTLADTLGFPWILPVEQTALRQELGAVFVDRGLTPPHGPHRVHVHPHHAGAAAPDGHGGAPARTGPARGRAPRRAPGRTPFGGAYGGHHRSSPPDTHPRSPSAAPPPRPGSGPAARDARWNAGGWLAVVFTFSVRLQVDSRSVGLRYRRGRRGGRCLQAGWGLQMGRKATWAQIVRLGSGSRRIAQAAGVRRSGSAVSALALGAVQWLAGFLTRGRSPGGILAVAAVGGDPFHGGALPAVCLRRHVRAAVADQHRCRFRPGGQALRNHYTRRGQSFAGQVGRTRPAPGTIQPNPHAQAR